MTKTFCDICGKEIETTERLKENIPIGHQGDTLMIEIITGLNGVNNNGHFHHKCIVDRLTWRYRDKKDGK